MMRQVIFLFLAIIVLLWSCSKHCPEKKLVTDLYKKSFHGKSVKYQIGYSENDHLVDTIEFDKNGNIIHIVRFWYEEWRTYDSLNRMIRDFILNDVPSNYRIEYRDGCDEIIQVWYLLRHRWLDEQEGEKLSSDSFMIKYSFDEKGLLVMEDNSRSMEITKYQYDKNDNLVSDRTFDYDSLEKSNFDYSYDKNGVLRKILLTEDSDTLLIHYFSSEGLLELTDYGDYNIYYRYIFYE